MANVLENIKQQAKLLSKNVVLPEGEDSRVVKAAAEVVKEGTAKITLLGNLEEIKKNNPDVDLTGINVIDPVTYDKTEEYAKILFPLQNPERSESSEERTDLHPSSWQ